MNENKLKIWGKRVPKELKTFRNSKSTHGITCEPVNESDFTLLEAMLPGPKNSPYESGTFKLTIQIGSDYPFSPPVFKFVTPIFHPNIDKGGKVCLDLLRLPPSGSYNPLITLESILLSIQLLLASPNPNDPLHKDASDLYKCDLKLFNETAKKYTRKYAESQSEQVESQLEHVNI